MASQTAPARSKEAPAAIAVNASKHPLHEHAQACIASRAYELYEQDGRNHGDDMSHWLRAESEILNRVPEIHESSSWFTINVPMKGFSAEEISVNVEPHRAILAAGKRQGPGEETNQSADQEGAAIAFQEATFAVAKWPSEVDPATASAYLKDGVLTVAVKRALPAGGVGSGNDFQKEPATR